MASIVKSGLAAACAAVLVGTGLAAPAAAQQSPTATAPPQAQSGPAMGAEMMQRGMERGRMGMGQGMGMPGMMDDGMMSMMKMMAAGPDHTEGRLAFVKAELKITDAQAPQWNAFADSVRANATRMVEMGRSMMASHQKMGATLPERLAAEDKAVSAHLAALKKVEESLDKLYGVLSADQKKIADGIVIGPMGMPMGMM